VPYSGKIQVQILERHTHNALRQGGLCSATSQRLDKLERVRLDVRPLDISHMKPSGRENGAPARTIRVNLVVAHGYSHAIACHESTGNYRVQGLIIDS
jgi:hypothetical protein